MISLKPEEKNCSSPLYQERGEHSSIDRYTEERVHDGITLESTSQSFNDSPLP